MDAITKLILLFQENWLLLVGDAFLIICAILAGRFFFKFLVGLQIKRNLERIKQRFFMDSEARELTAKRTLMESGYKEKYTTLEKLDALFKQAGYLNYEKNESTETILIKVGITIILISVVFGAFTRSVVIFAITIILCITVFLLATTLIADKKYVSVENEILRFINLADGYSSESDDIVYIIGKVYPQMKEPLYSYGKDFYYEALHINVDTAFQRLEERIPHRKFREVIHNIRTSSMTCSNYKKILSESRNIMRDYIDGKKERKNIKKGSIFDFCLVLALVGWSFFMADGLSPNFWDTMIYTIAGNVLIIAFVAIVGVGALMTFRIDKK